MKFNFHINRRILAAVLIFNGICGPLAYIAFAASNPPFEDLSRFWVVCMLFIVIPIGVGLYLDGREPEDKHTKVK